MRSNHRTLMLLMFGLSLTACAGKPLHEDFGKSVSHNTIQQTVNLEAAKEVHPEVKMDGQKADTVVDNYRSERPEADAEDLTK